MLNPLKIATDGYLKRTTKAVLVIAVAGYLNFGGTPLGQPMPGNVLKKELQGGMIKDERYDKKEHEIYEQNQIIEAFVRSFMNIINQDGH